MSEEEKTKFSVRALLNFLGKGDGGLAIYKQNHLSQNVPIFRKGLRRDWKVNTMENLIIVVYLLY